MTGRFAPTGKLPLPRGHDVLAGNADGVSPNDVPGYD